jgi:hypothetical protein
MHMHLASSLLCVSIGLAEAGRKVDTRLCPSSFCKTVDYPPTSANPCHVSIYGCGCIHDGQLQYEAQGAYFLRQCSGTDCVCTAGCSATEVTSGQKGSHVGFYKNSTNAGAAATRWLFNEALVRQSPEEGSQVYCNCARNDTQVGRCRIRSTVCAMFNSTEDVFAHKVRSNELGCYYGWPYKFSFLS